VPGHVLQSHLITTAAAWRVQLLLSPLAVRGITRVQGESSFMTHCFRELRKKFLALPLAAGLCCGAVAQQNQQSAMVTTSHMPGVDFSRYHTYRWVESEGQHHPDPTVDAQLKQSIDSQLAAKGLTKADGTADLNVNYRTAVSRTETWEIYEDWTQTALMDQRPQRKKIIIDAGTLVIDMYDTAAKSLVWTGRATKILDPDISREDRQKNLDNAARKLLADFPPK